MLFDKAIYYADPKAVTLYCFAELVYDLGFFLWIRSATLAHGIVFSFEWHNVHPSVFHHLHCLYTNAGSY
jgi:hypothetical protein